MTYIVIQLFLEIHCNGGTAAKDDNSPVEQVALTVPVTDNPTLSVVTFRMWFLDTITCFLLSFLNQFFFYRRQSLSVSSIFAQIAVDPLGHRVFFKGSKWEFTLNPDPFNVKDHVFIMIFTTYGAGNTFAIYMVSVVKLFYKQKLNFWVALIVIITTQILGFGWDGIFRRYLVKPAAMWLLQNLVQVSLFRALHDKEERAKNGLTRNQFFLIAFICNFAYCLSRLPFSNAKFHFLAVFVVLFLCPRPTVGFRASWPWSRRHCTPLVYHILLSWKHTS
ncbi:hypothetical protein H5410_008527 [Solanum commersonii]|uniref:Uncharacterized protein n=1 Tax=Solanum commersonii TaxID=4109 RepID=A0A9J6AF76_SOLCO|nr:hypothetical protein H5410_008527 [Solanum commersonii]